MRFGLLLTANVLHMGRFYHFYTTYGTLPDIFKLVQIVVLHRIQEREQNVMQKVLEQARER